MERSQVFVCRSRGPLGPAEDPDILPRLHAGVVELMKRRGVEHGLRGALLVSEPEGLELLLDAQDGSRALRRARKVLAEVLAELEAEQAEGAGLDLEFELVRSEGAVGPLSQHQDHGGAHGLTRAPVKRRTVRLPKVLRGALAVAGLGGEARELCIGVWERERSPFLEGPWSFMELEESEPRGRVRFLEGMRIEVDAELLERRFVRLTRELEGTGVQPLVLGETVREWLPEGRRFLTTCEHTKARRSLALFPMDDTLDLVTFFGTRGCADEDPSNREVLGRLRSWRREADFHVYSCGLNHVTLLFHQLPRELERFADEVYAFAPDVLDRSYLGPEIDDDELRQALIVYQTPRDLAESLRGGQALRLHWD